MREISLKSPEAIRAGAEEAFWRYHRLDFRLPSCFEKYLEEKDQEENSTPYQVILRQPDHGQIRKRLSLITPDECWYTCCKDVAIYLNPPCTDKFRYGLRFFDTVYYHFFPHRDMALDITKCHFFSQIIDVKPHHGGGTLSEIIRFHNDLCKTVEHRVPDMKESDPRLPDNFGLFSTFRNVLLIIEKDLKSKTPEVLVVCKDPDIAKRLNFDDGDIERDLNAGSAGKSDPEAEASLVAWPFRFRVGLVRFMDAIFALDEKRHTGVEPDSLFWRRNILDINDFTYVLHEEWERNLSKSRADENRSDVGV